MCGFTHREEPTKELWSLKTSFRPSDKTSLTILVIAKALWPPAVKDTPPQSPNHANHTRPVPSITSTLLWGICKRNLSSSVKYRREPTMKSDAKAEEPAVVCTTVE